MGYSHEILRPAANSTDERVKILNTEIAAAAVVVDANFVKRMCTQEHKN